jgi:hypothetical protein
MHSTAGRDELIDIDELRDDMTTVLEGEIRTPEDFLEETDTNGDGYIDFAGGLWDISFKFDINKNVQDIQIKQRNLRYTN